MILLGSIILHTQIVTLNPLEVLGRLYKNFSGKKKLPGRRHSVIFKKNRSSGKK